MTEPTPVPPTAVPVAAMPISTNEEVESAPVVPPVRAPRAPRGERTVWNELRWIGGKILSGMEYIGEGVADVLGLDDSHFQYVLDGMDEEDWEIAIAVANKRKREQQQQDDNLVAASIEEGGCTPASSDHMIRNHGSSPVDELETDSEDEDIEADADPEHPNPTPFGLVHHREEQDRYAAAHNRDDASDTEVVIPSAELNHEITPNTTNNIAPPTSTPENSSAALISDVNIEMTSTV